MSDVAVVAEEPVDFSSPKEAAAYLVRRGWTAVGLVGSPTCRFVQPGRGPRDSYSRIHVVTRWLARDKEERDENGFRPGWFAVIRPDEKGIPQPVTQVLCTPGCQPVSLDEALERQYLIESTPPATPRGQPTEADIKEALSSERLSEARDRWFSMKQAPGGLG